MLSIAFHVQRFPRSRHVRILACRILHIVGGWKPCVSGSGITTHTKHRAVAWTMGAPVGRGASPAVAGLWVFRDTSTATCLYHDKDMHQIY